MPQISKPNTLNKIWAAGGDRATPLDGKISSGWQIEIPPRQWFNWLDNRQDQAIAHFNQHGIPVWDDQTEYQAGKSYVQDPGNGLVYRCLATNVGNLPSSSPTFWTVAFADAAIAFSESQADAKYLAKSSNLADIPNKTQARNNLGVLSAAETNSLVNTSLKTTDFSGSNQQLAGTGYQKLPGGLIMQWGGPVGGAGTPATLSVEFPIPFPTECFQVSITQYGSSASDGHEIVTSFNRTSATIRRSSISATLYWFAIGR